MCSYGKLNCCTFVECICFGNVTCYLQNIYRIRNLKQCNNYIMLIFGFVGKNSARCHMSACLDLLMTLFSVFLSHSGVDFYV